jgi:hypothetical protein
MNLNQHHKQAIIAAVMNDVPRQHGESSIVLRAKKVIDDDIRQFAPRSVANIYFDKENSIYLQFSGQNIGYLSTEGSYTHDMPYVSKPSQYALSDIAKAEISKIITAASEEVVAIKKVESDLRAAISGLRTRKQFVAMFPELEKYAPEEPTTGTMLPAIANVVAGLSKLGWGNKEAAIA